MAVSDQLCIRVKVLVNPVENTTFLVGKNKNP